MRTKIRFGFKGKNQLPLFLMWREYWSCGVVVHAEVLFEIPEPSRWFNF
jgi:hypothetical protein